MLEAVPNPIAYGLAILCFGGWVLLAYMVRMLFTGKLCTGRELTEKDMRITALEQAVRTRDEQVDAALRVLPEVADVLRKFHIAAAEMQEDRP